MQTTVGLRLSENIVSQVICQHPSLYIRTVQGQMYCILSKDTVANQMLKFCGGHILYKCKKLNSLQHLVRTTVAGSHN